MKKKILIAALTGVGILLSSVGGNSRALAAEPIPAPAPAVATVNADPALWVIMDEDTTIYLLGTIHILKDNVKWFDGGVKAAYDASSELVIEADISNAAAAATAMIQRGTDPDGPPLSEKLGSDAPAYQDILKTYGIPAPALEKFKPWLVALTLQSLPLIKTGANAESGVETVLISASKKDGKTLATLETEDGQIAILDGLSEAVQMKYLRSAIAQMPAMAALTDELVSSWATGDPAQLGELTAKMTDVPELEKVLLNDRNSRWADWVEKRMAKPGTVFMAVGAGHLAGKNSVQEKLKAKKLIATRIPS